MPNIVPLRQTGALTRRDPRRLDLFKRTVGKELVGAEIDEAIEWCELYGANPFVKDIYFFAFGKFGTDERRVVPVLSVGMYRKIASRTGNYRPDDQPPRITYDKELIGPANPKGILSCEVSVYMHSHGDWHRVTSSLKWTERAPILVDGAFEWKDTGEVWPDSGKPKKKKVPIGSGAAVLDPRKPNWHTMGETMIAKCTEVDCIRKAWPEETSGSYGAEEMDAAHTIELTATEIIEKSEAERKLSMIGGRDAVTIDWLDNKPLARVPMQEIWDKSLAWMAGNVSSSEIRIWCDRNKMSRAEMKAKCGSDYLAWWQQVETRINALERAEAEVGDKE